MSDNADFETEFVKHRLRGDTPPPDLLLLLKSRNPLAARTGIELDASAGWAPWLNTSYLSSTALKDPSVRANIRAIADVSALIDFVAMDEDRNFFGYWRGPAHLPLADAPIVCLDNEGQFRFVGTKSLAGILFAEGGALDDFRSWFRSIGINDLPTGRYDLFTVRTEPAPGKLHEELYAKYELEERGG